MYDDLSPSFQISDYLQYSHTECDYPSYKYHSPNATVHICELMRGRKNRRLLRGENGERKRERGGKI